MGRATATAVLLLTVALSGCTAGTPEDDDSERPRDAGGADNPGWPVQPDSAKVDESYFVVNFEGTTLRIDPADPSTWDGILLPPRHPSYRSLATPIDESNWHPNTREWDPPPGETRYATEPPPAGFDVTGPADSPGGVGPGDVTAPPCVRPVHDEAQKETFRKFLVEEVVSRSLQGAALAVTDECGLLYLGAYGVYGENPNRPQATWDDAPAFDALWRIGRMSKVLGAAALQHLVATTSLDWDDKVFCLSQFNPDDDCVFYYVGSKPGGTLGSLQNPSLTFITVRDIQGHSSGLNTFNPLVMEHQVSTEVGNAGQSDLTEWDFIWWQVDEPMKFSPGSQHEYSNFGHFLVGPVVELVSGIPYEEYLCLNVLDPVGIDCDDIIVAGARPYEWAPREVGHDRCDPEGTSHLATSPWHEDPDWPVEFGTKVCREKGGLMLKIAATTGGIASTAEAQAQFYRHYWSPWAGSPHAGLPRTSYWNPPAGATMWGGADAWPDFDAGWNDGYGHNGGLQDAQTQARQCTSGLNMVLLTALNVASEPGLPSGWAFCDLGDEFQDRPFLGMTFQEAGGLQWQHDVTPASQIQDVFDARSAAYRLLDINGYRMGDSIYYATTWVEESGSDPLWRVRWGLTEPQLQAQADEWDDDGYYPVKVSAYMDGATPRYAAVFHENTAGYAYDLVLDASRTEFHQMADTHEAARAPMRAVSVDTFQPDGVFPQIAGIFVNDGGDSYVFTASNSLDGIEATRDALGPTWRVSELEPRYWDDEVWYAGLMEQGSQASDYKAVGNWDAQWLMDKWKIKYNVVPISIAGADTAWNV